MNEIVLDISRVPTPESLSNSKFLDESLHDCQCVIDDIARKLKQCNVVPFQSIETISPVPNLSKRNQEIITDAMKTIGWKVLWEHKKYDKFSSYKDLFITISRL